MRHRLRSWRIVGMILVAVADAGLLAAQASHQPVYAPLFPFEVEAVTQQLGGRWEQVATINPATHITIWRLQP